MVNIVTGFGVAGAAIASGITSRPTNLMTGYHGRENLAPYLRVRRLELWDLPKTISGKIRRVELRAREQDDPAAAARTEWRDDQFPELRA
ncbi:hypothetical protein PA7_04130 [Pseudonocardia asaccharolytica DSM 44247 = NBRC 16224]|uniref:AMP-binding enzyme C-terminal domain-containing protein n=1 Tax=Pseudonocardia asaccharolytica DSM 44247 = NBRC 16224 TaxID=1123024 RepID=A0A511CVG8_9PSEU|nr:hypothetical protein PA7_04130 [Pseudonocardia asaccharolytica DSM 44247 = NBRC 16224]